MRIIITGATGFVGKNLISALDCKRNYVSCIVRRIDENSNFLEKKGAKIAIGDLSDKRFLRSVINRSDVVIHLAANLHRPDEKKAEVYKTNIQYTKNILDSCKNGQKIIFCSTAGVYGKCIDAYEKTNPNPGNYYEKSKCLAENHVRRYDNHIILRPNLVFGAMDNNFSRIFPLIKKRLFFIIGDGKNIIQPLFVDDLTKAIIKIINSNIRNKTYNLAGKKIEFQKFAEYIAEGYGVKLNRTKIPLEFAKITIGMYEAVCKIIKIKPIITVDGLMIVETRTYSIEKIEKEFKFKATDTRKAVDKTISALNNLEKS